MNSAPMGPINTADAIRRRTTRVQTMNPGECRAVAEKQLSLGESCHAFAEGFVRFPSLEANRFSGAPIVKRLHGGTLEFFH